MGKPLVDDGTGFATVEFALVEGGTHKQRVTYNGRHEGPSELIPRAAKACKRRGLTVANVQRITRGDAVLFHHTDTGRGWR